MNIDLIVSWGRNCDYPLWRYWLHQNRMSFKKVIVVFTESNLGEDYREFIKLAMAVDNVDFIQSPILKPNEDWRDVAVNEALKISNAEWVYFTEQDFLPVGFYMGRIAVLMSEKWDCIGAYDSGRLHPCAIFCKRELVDKTSKYFGIKEGEFDHFGLFQKEVEALVPVGRIPEVSYVHFNGYSHNWRLASDGQMPNYKPDEFIKSLEESMSIPVPLSPKWVDVAIGCINRHSE
jgi:hypothetical protein